ncbi:unnamed protein product [Paramecium sonneborni]|uniref:Transmembrane protein n=1 Tax=Paramecium sonneborni TaxID=65129 RepID=A0A8S1K614_9CILI|nr:unnamed protein product [Paramecium sonneborni]
MNETLPDEQIQQEFPSDDQGEKFYSEEEILYNLETQSVPEDFIESDIENNQDNILIEEIEYYYEYIDEEISVKNISEENENENDIQQTFLLDQDEQEQILQKNHSFQNNSDFNQKMDSQIESNEQEKISEELDEFSDFLNKLKIQDEEEENNQENQEGYKEENKKEQQQKEEKIDEEQYFQGQQQQQEEEKNQNSFSIQEEEEEFIYIEEEELIYIEEEEENYIYNSNQEKLQDKQEEPIVLDSKFDQQTSIIKDTNQSLNQENSNQQQNISQNNYSSNPSKSFQSKQILNHYLKLYFDLVCQKEEENIEQENVTQLSRGPSEIPIIVDEINPILLGHTIIMTLLVIFVSINDKQSNTIKIKEPFQQNSITSIQELNEYMPFMINRLKQQYNMIAQSQEQLAYQLELLEQ